MNFSTRGFVSSFSSPLHALVRYRSLSDRRRVSLKSESFLLPMLCFQQIDSRVGEEADKRELVIRGLTYGLCAGEALPSTNQNNA